MKIAISGTINRDKVITWEGISYESLGGLMYSILTAAVLAPEGATIYPIANVGYDIFEEVDELLSGYGNIDLSGLERSDSPNNVVYLHINEENERDEFTELNLPPVDYTQIEPYLDADALLLNMTSGFEFDESLIREINLLRQGTLYLDVHSLTLGIDERGHRFRRKIPHPLNWLQGVDFVQLTADEAFSFHRGKVFTIESATSVAQWIGEIVDNTCLMTMGERGVLAHSGDDIFFKKAEEVEIIEDTTGCGDVFGMSFLIEYLSSGNLRKAVEYGIQKSAIKCGFTGIEEMRRLALEV